MQEAVHKGRRLDVQDMRRLFLVLSKITQYSMQLFPVRVTAAAADCSAVATSKDTAEEGSQLFFIQDSLNKLHPHARTYQP
jgi:hypothetical protein